MKKTGKIYNVQLALFAWIPVEAESPEEAMKIANKYVDDIDNEKFEDSEVYVEACETYSRDLDEIDPDESIYTEEGEMSYDEYIYQMGW